MAERTIEVRLVASTAQFQAAMGAAGAQVKAFSRDVSTTLASTDQKTLQHMEKIGKGMLVAGAAIAGGFALSAKAAIDFESAFAGVRKTVDGTDTQMRALSDGIRAMSRQLPASAVEIASVAAAAGQLGIQRPAILAFSRTMVDLGETTNLSADEAATSLARMMNVMGTAQGDVDRMGSTLVALGNAGASTESEILELAQRLASAGRTIGLTESDVLAFANTLSSLGIEAEAGGSAVSRVFVEMGDAVLDQNEKLAVFARTAGMSSAEFSAAFRDDAAGAVASFVEGLGRVVASGQSTTGILDELGFSELRVSRALRDTALGGDLLRDSLELGSRAWEENAALAEEAGKRYDTTAAQLEIARNNVVDLAVGFGEELMPAVRVGSTLLVTFTDNMRNLPGPVQGTVTGVAALTGGLLLAGGAVGVLVPRVQAARTALVGLGQAGIAANRGLGLLGRAAGVAGVLLTIVTAADALNAALNPGPDVGKLTDALDAFGASGVVNGELARSFGGDLQNLADDINYLYDLSNADRLKKLFSGEDILIDSEQTIRLEKMNETLSQMVQGGNVAGAASAFDQLKGALLGLGVAEEDVETAFAGYLTAAADAEEQTRLLAGSQPAVADGMGDIADGAEDAADGVDRLSDALDALIGIHVDAAEAEIAFRDGLVDLREALDENINSFDLNTQAGRDNTAAFADQAGLLADRVQAVYDHTEAVEGEAAALEAARSAFEDGVQDLRDLAWEAGLTEDQTRTLLEQFGLAAGFGPIETEFKTTGVDRTIADIEAVATGLRNLVNEAGVPFYLQAPGSSTMAGQTNRNTGVPFYLQPNAAGALYADDRGMGDRHKPEIARAGSYRLFGERETMGEAYLPLAADWRRPRAEAILAEVAQRFGGEFVKYATGGIRIPVEVAFASRQLPGSTAAATGGSGARGGGSVATASAPANVNAVQSMARNMAASRGWVGREWDALYRLVQAESGWRPTAQNPTSTAYGLFQFLNSTWAGVGAQKTADPAGQIRAGLQYIANRYGSPSKAWSFWNAQSPHWYRAGGLLLPGRGGRSVSRFASGGLALPGSVQAFASGGWGRPDLLSPRPNPNPDVARGPAREAEEEARAAEQAAREAQQALDEAARAADEARRRQRDIEDNMAATGRVNVLQYIALLDQRLAAEVQFSSEWMAVHRERERVLEELGRVEQDRYRHQVEINNNLFRLGRISLADHLGNLERRMAKEEEFSGEWMTLHDERQRLIDEESERIGRSLVAFDTIRRSLGQAAMDEVAKLNLSLDELEDRAEAAERQARELIDGLTSVYTSAQDAFTRQAQDFEQAVRRRDEALVEEIERFRDSIRDPILDAGDLISTFGRRAERVSGDEIVNMLDHRLEAVRRYKAGLETLAGSGINEDLLTGLAQAGPGAVNLVEALAGGDPAEINRRLAEMAALGEDVSSVFVTRNRAAIEDRVNRENTLPVMRSFNDLLAEELQRQTDAQVARNEAKTWAEQMAASTLPGLTAGYGALTGQVQAYAQALRDAAAAASMPSGAASAVAGPGLSAPSIDWQSGGPANWGAGLANIWGNKSLPVSQPPGVSFAPGALVVSVRVEDGEVADVALSGPGAGTGLGKALRVVSHGAGV